MIEQQNKLPSILRAVYSIGGYKMATKAVGYGFSRRLDELTVLEREYREVANFANFPESICVIRRLAYFALKNFLSCESPEQ